MAVHGTTRSKELVTLLHKFGIGLLVGLLYQDTLDLEAAWAISELDEISKCRVRLYNCGKLNVHTNLSRFKSF